VERPALSRRLARRLAKDFRRTTAARRSLHRGPVVA